MNNTVQPAESNNVLPLPLADRHPEWCGSAGDCRYVHSTGFVKSDRSDRWGEVDRPEFSWNLSVDQRTDGTRGMHVAGSMFFSNDMKLDQVAGLRCSVDDAERFANDLLEVVALIREREPRPSVVSSLDDFRAVRDGAR